MLREILTIGDKIDVKPLDKNGRPVHNARTFVSQLVDFVDFDVIQIAAPIIYGKAIMLGTGEYYNLCFYSSKGLYQCRCTVLSSHKDNNLIIIVVRITTNLEKYQRRQYYRLECIHEIKYHLVSVEEEILDRKLRLDEFVNDEEREACRKRLAELDKDWVSGAVTDLSGGGARYSSDQPLKHGDKIRINFDFIVNSAMKKMILGADVIASTKIVNKKDLYEHRIEFNDIMQKDREILIKYIFEQERKRRRNEKG